MMIRYSKIVLLFLLVMSSCKTHEDEYHSVTEKIEAETQFYQGVSVTSELYFGDIETIEITEGNHTFLVPERKGQIKSYQCTECHTLPVEQMKDLPDGKKAHWDIKLVHADDDTMNCATCHNGNNMDNLQSLTNKSIDFNESHRLCSQCHTRQFDDWIGGAHGKQLGGWAPPRASMNCVNCHNPHDPGFETKWPARFNTKKIKERD